MYGFPWEIKRGTDNLCNNNMNIILFNNNNNLRGGRPASTSLWSPYRRPGITGKPGIHLAPSRFGFPQSRFPPYVVGTLHMHGASAYGEDIRPEVKMKPQACPGKVRRASLGDVGGPNSPQAGPFRSPWAALAVQAAERRSKRLNRTERRRAPNVTPSVVWGTHVSQNIGITLYF